MARSAATLYRMASIWGSILGACAIMVMSALHGPNPSPASISTHPAKKHARIGAFPARVGVGEVFAYVAERCRSGEGASARAWRATSASLWPSSPSSKGISTPHIMHGRPSTRRWTSNPLPILEIGNHHTSRVLSAFAKEVAKTVHIEGEG